MANKRNHPHNFYLLYRSGLIAAIIRIVVGLVGKALHFGHKSHGCILLRGGKIPLLHVGDLGPLVAHLLNGDVIAQGVQEERAARTLPTI